MRVHTRNTVVRLSGASWAWRLARCGRGLLPLFCACAGLVFQMYGNIALAAASPIPREYQVKAAFLYNMPKFTEWPPQSFTRPSDPIVIGVFGRNPFGNDLEAMVSDRKINGRAILIKYVETLDDAKATHVLFVGAGEEARFALLRPGLDASPVLTVGETALFAESGGIIQFVPVGDKLRFEINIASAERVGLKLSAQLQKLATTVRRTP